MSILSIVSTTNFASSILKHIGGLNFSTFLPGPSVLSRMCFSLSLERAVTKNYIYLCMYFRKASNQQPAGCHTVPFYTDWFQFWPVGSHIEALHGCPCTLLLNPLLLLWLESFLLGPWLGPLQWISHNLCKRNKNSQSVSEEGATSELKSYFKRRPLLHENYLMFDYG